MPSGLNDTQKGLWSIYHLGVVVRYGTLPEFRGSFGPQGDIQQLGRVHRTVQLERVPALGSADTSPGQKGWTILNLVLQSTQDNGLNTINNGLSPPHNGLNTQVMALVHSILALVHNKTAFIPKMQGIWTIPLGTVEVQPQVVLGLGRVEL